MIKEKLVHYSTRLEQLKQFQQSGEVVSTAVPFGLKPGMQPIYLAIHNNIQNFISFLSSLSSLQERNINHLQPRRRRVDCLERRKRKRGENDGRDLSVCYCCL